MCSVQLFAPQFLTRCVWTFGRSVQDRAYQLRVSSTAAYYSLHVDRPRFLNRDLPLDFGVLLP